MGVIITTFSAETTNHQIEANNKIRVDGGKEYFSIHIMSGFQQITSEGTKLSK